MAATTARPPQTPKAQDENRLKENDIVILVTGTLRAGKSTFVNALLGTERMIVGHRMTGCTTDIDYGVIPAGSHNRNGRRLVIVDTPGFDNTEPNLNDTAILRNISDWLELHFRSKIILGGVIYLHDISLSRFSSIASYDLTVLRAAFGSSKESFEKVAFVTTKWDRVDFNQGHDREKELCSIWDDLIRRGSQVYRFENENSSTSAGKIVDALLSHGVADSSSDLAERLKDFREKLPNNSGERITKDLLSSFLKLLMALFGRGNRSTVKVNLSFIGAGACPHLWTS